MASLQKLQNLVQTARATTQEKPQNMDAVRASIYDVAIKAFMKEVLTLNRMRGVIQAVCEGVNDGTATASGASESDGYALSRMQQGAYRGLCAAADEGLTAIGLAYSEYARLSGHSARAGFGSAWLHDVRAFKQQLDQITLGADWASNSAVTGLQSYWFEKLLNPETANTNAEEVSALDWDDRFFQVCGYEAERGKSNAKASLMLLGLLTNGTLLGIRRSYAVP